MKKIMLSILLCLAAVLSLQLPAAYAGVPSPGPVKPQNAGELNRKAMELFEEFTEKHPEYQYRTFFDLDGDGISELFLRERNVPDDDEVCVCTLSPDGETLTVCSMRSKYLTIAYDAYNKAIVGESGGTGAACYCLLTVERQKLFAWYVGKDTVFPEDVPELRYYLYGEPAQIYENGMLAYKSGRYIDKNGNDAIDMDFFDKYGISEEEYQEYADWFRSLSPLIMEKISS